VHLSLQAEAPVVVGLRQGFKDLGYTEGSDVVLEVRAGQGRYETALEAARELVKLPVHVFVSAGTVATRAVNEAAGDLPIVFTQVGEPVASGFVQSLALPGGNLTGFSHLLSATTGKRLELLLESCRPPLDGTPGATYNRYIARER
jgi:putative ABC transport system substrate-binding protein